MRAHDKLRSFAESRSGDQELIRDGLTYGDARELRAGSGRVVALTPDDTATLYRWLPDDGTFCGALHDAIQLWAAEQEALARRGDRPETEVDDE